jgi:mRNA interferase MazF
MTSPRARRGEIWLADLDPVRGNEQAGIRPVLVISATRVGVGPGGLAIVVPLTGTPRANQGAVEIPAGEGGLRVTSYALPVKLRSIARERLLARWGEASPATVDLVADRVRIAVGLPATRR